MELLTAISIILVALAGLLNALSLWSHRNRMVRIEKRIGRLGDEVRGPDGLKEQTKELTRLYIRALKEKRDQELHNGH